MYCYPLNYSLLTGISGIARTATVSVISVTVSPISVSVAGLLAAAAGTVRPGGSAGAAACGFPGGTAGAAARLEAVRTSCKAARAPASASGESLAARLLKSRVAPGAVRAVDGGDCHVGRGYSLGRRCGRNRVGELMSV